MKTNETADIFDIVSHLKIGAQGRVRAIYEVDGILYYDVETGEIEKNIVYRTPAKNWKVIQKSEVDPETIERHVKEMRGNKDEK